MGILDQIRARMSSTGVTSMHQGLGQAANMNAGNALHAASNAMVGSAVSGGQLGPMIYAGGGGSGGGWMPSRSHTNITISEVENGYVVNINGVVFICESAEQISERIIAAMVTNKLEK